MKGNGEMRTNSSNIPRRIIYTHTHIHRNIRKKKVRKKRKKRKNANEHSINIIKHVLISRREAVVHWKIMRHAINTKTEEKHANVDKLILTLNKNNCF